MHIKKFEAADLQAALAQIRDELGPEALILESRNRTGLRGGIEVLAALPHAGPDAQPKTPIDQPVPAEERSEYLARLVRSDHFSAIPLPLRELYLELVDAEVDSTLVYQLLRRMGESPFPGKFTPAPPDELLAMLRSLVQTGGALGRENGRRVIALVGPTGVGKTTTVAKIAGLAAFHLKKKVALVSTDAYRVFGAQHLASYGALMGLPFESVTSQSEMRWLLESRLSGADLVLVDTSGRSPRDPEGIAEIHQLLGACPDLDVHLVLAANGRVRDLGLALESFSVLPIRHLIFTKVDETTTRGGIYSTALKARRPVSYLGTGQEVPDDLEAATREALTLGLLVSDPREEIADARSSRAA